MKHQAQVDKLQKFVLLAGMATPVEQLVLDLADEIVDLETQLSTMLGLFGDYDFHPTVEQCQKFWNHLMEERRQLRVELKRLRESKC